MSDTIQELRQEAIAEEITRRRSAHPCADFSPIPSLMFSELCETCLWGADSHEEFTPPVIADADEGQAR